MQRSTAYFHIILIYIKFQFTLQNLDKVTDFINGRDFQNPHNRCNQLGGASNLSSITLCLPVFVSLSSATYPGVYQNHQREVTPPTIVQYGEDGRGRFELSLSRVSEAPFLTQITP